MVRSDNPDFGPPVEALGVAIAGQSGIATVDRAALALEFARVFREDFDQIVPLECGGRSLAALASDLTTQLGPRPAGDLERNLTCTRTICSTCHRGRPGSAPEYGSLCPEA